MRHKTSTVSQPFWSQFCPFEVFSNWISIVIEILLMRELKKKIL